MMKDETNNKYEYLTVIGFSHKDKGGNAFWKCKCECGNMIVVKGASLRNGHTKSCGCYHKKVSQKQGINNRKQNKYDLTSCDYGIGFTKDGDKFYFDKKYYDFIKDFCWYKDEKGYIKCKRKHNISLHRYVMSLTVDSMSGLEVDHINNKPYDNRIINLRLVTSSQNKMNRRNIKGIYFDKKKKKYIATITKDKVKHYLGSYDTKEKAISIRKKAEKNMFGDFMNKKTMESELI